MTIWNSLGPMGLGLALGMRHATDPDHVVAVTAIAARHRHAAQAAGIGALWGLGHMLTLCLVGAAIIVFKLTVPPRLGLWMELAVGVALIVVGALALRGRGGPVSSAAGAGTLPRLRAFLVGVVHGLAGSAAVALLVLATVRDVASAVAYLVVFALGTVAGMMLITLTFAIPTGLAAHRFRVVAPAVRWITGLASTVFGLWVMYQVAFVDGLFRAAPHWTPR